MENYLEVVEKRKRTEIEKIMICNEVSSEYGLVLSQKQILDLVEKKNDVLKNTGRVEFRECVIEKIIKLFCDSPYISQNDCESVLGELVEVFYEYKNLTMDVVSDDELIRFMKMAFDGVCKGDVGYLAGTVMEKMRRQVIGGKRIDDVKVGDDIG